MSRTTTESPVCYVCKQKKRPSELIPGDLVRDGIASIIRRSLPEWSYDKVICLPDLNRFRAEYVKELLEEEKGELSSLEESVIESFKQHDVVTQNINQEYDDNLSRGEWLADHISTFGGSWKFIILFGATLGVWILLNSSQLLAKPFDPYPFILLNLVLSCLAAIQAPIIMMSQNRLEAKDRLKSEQDYRTNLKAELEIQHTNAKLDQLLSHQWRRLMEIQQIQMQMIEELARTRGEAPKDKKPV
jgi:uncharacterized membrane protein